VSITISADDPRTIRAIELAAEADQWLRGHSREGQEVYGIPSQSEPGHYYIVSGSNCDCPDFRHNADERRPCKHVLAIRLHTELVRAQDQITRARRRDRGHLSVVATAHQAPEA
jgi:SWIM zinc finger